MRKFEKVFCPHPNFRFPTAPLLEIADEIVYACDTPMFDDLMGKEHRASFEGSVAKKLEDFDSDADCIAFYGDPIIFAMMVTCALSSNETVKIARYSQKLDKYVVREINAGDDWFNF